MVPRRLHCGAVLQLALQYVTLVVFTERHETHRDLPTPSGSDLLLQPTVHGSEQEHRQQQEQQPRLLQYNPNNRAYLIEFQNTRPVPVQEEAIVMALVVRKVVEVVRLTTTGYRGPPTSQLSSTQRMMVREMSRTTKTPRLLALLLRLQTS